MGDGRKDRKAEERGREEDWGCSQWGGRKTEGKRRMEMAGKRWTDGQSGGGWGGEMNSPRGKEMDGNQRERRPDMGHDPRGGPGDERKPETIKVVPGITWLEAGRRGEMGAPGDFTESLEPLPLPLLPSWLSGRGSPTKLKSSLSSRLSVPGGGEVRGGSCLSLLFSVAFSGHPLAATLGSLRSVFGHGSLFLGVTP